MKKFLIALVLVVVGATLMVNAQQSLGQVASGPSVPSGACGNGSLYTVTGTGALYSCNAGSWALVSGGGGSTAFSAITAGTNAHALVMGTGGTLGTSGTGTITATALSPAGTSGNCAQWGTSGAMGDAGAPCGSGSSAFNAITSGTNTTAAMVVGTGGSLAASGSGTITATAVPFSGVTGTVTATKLSPAGTSGNAVTWGASGAVADAGGAPTIPFVPAGGAPAFVFPAGGTVTGTTVAASTTVKILPFQIPYAVTFSHLSCSVATADSGHTSDCGIYLPTSSTVATLKASWGGTTSSATGFTDLTLTQGTVTLQPGYYYMAFVSASTTFAEQEANNCFMPTNVTTSTTASSGVLPGTITITVGSIVSANGPYMILR
jgi:hypothetical protein